MVPLHSTQLIFDTKDRTVADTLDSIALRVTALEALRSGIASAFQVGPAPVATVPGDVLNLDNWYLTLPTKDATTGFAQEIKQPALRNYSDDAFRLAPTGGVQFTVHHGAPGVTKSSLNPRSELRGLPSFSPTSGKQYFTLSGHVDQLTTVKPEVVLAQVHGITDDLCVFRLEGTTLYRTNGNDDHSVVVDKSLAIGQPYTLGFVIGSGKIQAVYNGNNVGGLIPITDPLVYVKGGLYLQSNPQTAPSETTSAFARVTVTALTVLHSL